MQVIKFLAINFIQYTFFFWRCNFDLVVEKGVTNEPYNFYKRSNNSNLETGVYQISTDNNIYISWNTHSPTKWKIETHRNLIKLAKFICSNEVLLNKEMKHLMKVFYDVND